MKFSNLFKCTIIFMLGISPASALSPVPVDTSQQKFLSNITQYCGKAFEGKIIANTPASNTPDPFEGKTLVMHIRECNTQEVRIPFFVGEDRSRTWVITHTREGLRLKHDHRLASGESDPVTMYGGDTIGDGSEYRQEFPVDAESIALFTSKNMNASNNNQWAIEIHPKDYFLYELTRPNGRKFQVKFDLTHPVALPPAPWGSK